MWTKFKGTYMERSHTVLRMSGLHVPRSPSYWRWQGTACEARERCLDEIAFDALKVKLHHTIPSILGIMCFPPCELAVVVPVIFTAIHIPVWPPLKFSPASTAASNRVKIVGPIDVAIVGPIG